MEKITWFAPTERTDNSPLTQEEIDGMVYQLGYQPVGQADQVYTELAAFPGSLNPDGKYEVALADLSLPEMDIDIALKAVDSQNRQSGWSNEAQLYLGKGPKAPTGLTVA